MREREKRHFNIFASKPILAVLLFTSVLFGFYAFNSSYQKYQIKKEISSLDANLSELEMLSGQMKDEKNKLTSEEYIEKEARIKLNFKKANEEVVVLVDRPYLSGEDNRKFSTSNTETKKSSAFSPENAKKWIEVIFGN